MTVGYAANIGVLSVIQQTFVESLQEEYGRFGCNPPHTPGESTHKVYLDGEEPSIVVNIKG